MRRFPIVVCLSATTLTLGVASLAAPSAGADSGRGGDTKEVRLFDDCDPATFNAAIGPGTCVGDGETTFGDFIAQLQENGFVANESADDWEFKPEDFHIDRGDRIKVVNRGGETHTFTEVAEFGGGCVPELNAVLGGLTPVPECADEDLFVSTMVLAGDTMHVHRLAPGTHKFECLIHPWMQSVVEVRSDGDHGGHGHG